MGHWTASRAYEAYRGDAVEAIVALGASMLKTTVAEGSCGIARQIAGP